MLETQNLAENAAISTRFFVGMARSVGLAARDVYGIRVASSARGYRSLGVGSPVISKGRHCRAEFFAQGVAGCRWIRRTCAKWSSRSRPESSRSTIQVEAARKRLFGSWEMNWLAYKWGTTSRCRIRAARSSGS